jgi:hypothetical protein
VSAVYHFFRSCPKTSWVSVCVCVCVSAARVLFVVVCVCVCNPDAEGGQSGRSKFGKK